MMKVNRYFGNPIIKPEDVRPSLYEDNKVKLYYGAADTCIAYAEIDSKIFTKVSKLWFITECTRKKLITNPGQIIPGRIRFSSFSLNGVNTR